MALFKPRKTPEQLADELMVCNEAVCMIATAHRVGDAIKWVDVLARNVDGLESYTRHQPMICGSVSAWSENGKLRIDKRG